MIELGSKSAVGRKSVDEETSCNLAFDILIRGASYMIQVKQVRNIHLLLCGKRMGKSII